MGSQRVFAVTLEFAKTTKQRFLAVEFFVCFHIIESRELEDADVAFVLLFFMKQFVAFYKVWVGEIHTALVTTVGFLFFDFRMTFHVRV